MADNIAGKVIVMTGASSGLGEACARLLGSKGAKLVMGRVGTIASKCLLQS